MNDRHRIRLRCDDGCGATLTIRVDGAGNVEPHLHKLRIVLADLAAADGWLDGRCPNCRRWNEKPANVIPIRPVVDEASTRCICADGVTCSCRGAAR